MSAGEIILILFIYIMLFGAKGVPALAQTLGKAIYQFRNASRDVQNEIMKTATEVRKQADIKLDQLAIDDDVPIPTPVSPASDAQSLSKTDAGTVPPSAT